MYFLPYNKPIENILIVAHTPGISGGRQVALGLSKLLECDLYYLKNSNEKSKRFSIHYLSLLIRILAQLRKRLLRENYDCIIAEGLFSGIFLILFLKCPMLNIPNKTVLITRLGRRWLDHRFKFVWFLVFYFSDHVITPFGNNMKHWEGKKRFRKIINKASVVKNPLFIPVKRKFQNKRSDFVVIGRNIKEKRIKEASRFGAVLASYFGEKLTVVTDRQSDNITHKQKNINVMSFRDNIWDEFGSCRALINFAYNEGFSLVTAEAYILGIPTISLDGDSGQNDFIREFDAGLIVSEADSIECSVKFLQSWEYCSQENFIHEYNTTITNSLFNIVVCTRFQHSNNT